MCRGKGGAEVGGGSGGATAAGMPEPRRDLPLHLGPGIDALVHSRSHKRYAGAAGARSRWPIKLLEPPSVSVGRSEVFGGGVYSVVRHTSSAATDTSAPKTSASASSALWDSPTADSLYGVLRPRGGNLWVAAMPYLVLQEIPQFLMRWKRHENHQVGMWDSLLEPCIKPIQLL
ncbi:hypothetical protein QJS10_CPB20g00777 [Acorus calamus]|uniref:Uncharacterized protein n=1 Tax=Acorus calamus TaxID=4465 RepID=A0AAV9CEF0_ACOCL|nr:hypothetical protein QJS10_CPB20g00777 [Acorus calamus]